MDSPFVEKTVQIEGNSTERGGRRRPKIRRESAGKSAVEGGRAFVEDRKEGESFPAVVPEV
jgi:hypothetical protein